MDTRPVVWAQLTVPLLRWEVGWVLDHPRVGNVAQAVERAAVLRDLAMLSWNPEALEALPEVAGPSTTPTWWALRAATIASEPFRAAYAAAAALRRQGENHAVPLVASGPSLLLWQMWAAEQQGQNAVHNSHPGLVSAIETVLALYPDWAPEALDSPSRQRHP